jgi:signal transduction histidine kinase/CheY-like chemotaxis protein
MIMKQPARVLIIDDEKDLCQLLSEYLKSKGYETAVAYNGEEGLEKLKQARFQLVISDLKMPKLSGLETLDRIKRSDPHVEVVLLTAFGSVPTAIEALKLGAYDFIEKPVKLERLVQVIEGALERRELKTIIGFEETTRAVFSTVRLKDLLPLLADLALSVAPAEEAFMAIQEGDRLVPAAFSAVGETRGESNRIKTARIVAEHAERSRCFLAEPMSDERFSGTNSKEEVRFLLAYPMWAQSEFLGVIGLCRTRAEDPFSARETHNFSLFAALVTEAVRSARLYSDLERKMEELRRAELKVIQNEKMAALGRIISGLAHELKNPLAGILLNTEMLAKDTKDPATKDIASDIGAAATRCNGIIENLLSYSRAAQFKKVEAPPEALLDAALGLLKSSTELARCRVVRDSVPCPPAIVNSIQLEQVFRNVLQNAAQAMPEGGTITVRVRPVRARRETLLRWAAPGAAAVVRSLDQLREPDGEQWAVVEIKDEGVGIAPEDLPQLFEPFFTTKDPGEGTGLGLYLSYEIVNANGGALWVSSAGKGQGTAFFIALPASPAAPIKVGEKV